MNNRLLNTRWLMSLMIVNVFILCILGVPAARTDPIPHDFLSWAFYLVAYLAQNILFAAILTLILLPVFLWVRRDSVKIIISFIPVTLLLLLSFIDSKVFAFWRSFVNGNILDLYFSKGGGSQVFEINNDLYVWIVSVAIVFVVLSFVTLFIARRLSKHFHFKRWILFFMSVYVIAQGVFIVLCMQSAMGVLQYSMKVPYFCDLSWSYFLENMHISIFPKAGLVKQLQNAELVERKMHYPLHPLQYHVPQHPMNVLLIVVDSLRYDMVNTINMPNVFHFAAHANQFMDNISGGDCTKPGIFSLFYGIPATYWRSALAHRQESIVIRAFSENHYDLKLLGSAPLLSPPFDLTVFSKIKALQLITPGNNALERDRYITTEMDGFLNHEKKSQHPFFGFIFYDAPHAYNALPLDHPFHPVGFLNYFSIDAHTPRTPIFNLYKNAVFADDQFIHQLLETLKKNRLMGNTIVIITSDHGQEFNDNHNNYWEHASGFSKYQVRTPMIIAWPHRTPTIYHDQTTHFDLAPTLLKNVLGVTNPVRDYSVGDDFFSSKQPSFIILGNYAYYALIMKNKIMQFHHSGMYRWTDLMMQPITNHELEKSTAAEFFNEMARYH